MAFPSGCSESDSAEAAKKNKFSIACCSGAALLMRITCGVPWVSVPVLSNVRVSTAASRSNASPSRTRKPCLVAFPMAAIMAVGVASTSAQGQNTTRMVTARMSSPEISQVSSAAESAMTTIQVAHRSAMPTILAFPASADCTS